MNSIKLLVIIGFLHVFSNNLFGQLTFYTIEQEYNLSNPTTFNILKPDADGTSVIFQFPPSNSVLSPDGKVLTIPNVGILSIDLANGAISFTRDQGFISGQGFQIKYKLNGYDYFTNSEYVFLFPIFFPLPIDDNIFYDTHFNLIDRILDFDILTNDKGKLLILNTIKFSGTANPGDPLIVQDEGTWQINQATGLVSFFPFEPTRSRIFSPISYSGIDNVGNISNTAFIKLTVFFYLPLNLISFSAKQKSQTIELNWQTANEVNTQSFDIERSADSKKFEKIGSVVSKNSSEQDNYSFIDQNSSSYNSHILYYRLKMNDLDGQFSYSKIVAASLEKEHSINISPNPTTGKALLNLAGKSELLNTLVSINNLAGQNIKQFKINKLTEEIDLSAFPKAVYLVKFVDGSEIKIIKD